MRGGKRAFDLIASAAGLLILSPLFVAIALAIRAGSKGPAFFSQERVGLAGKPFRILKFRTMVADSEELGGPLTVGADPRITPLGALLRRYKLDELPQLVNVISGEMTLVGPRPEVPRYVARYTSEQRRVLDLVPGVTDPASLEYRNEASLLAVHADPETAYLKEVMPDKIRLNLQYAAGATMRSDVELILRTLRHLGR